MGIEQKVNYQLNKYPAVKKVIKRVYQVGMYAISKKIRSEGDISRISPNDQNHEYFFGYYDKSPWDFTDRYMLCMKANDTWSDVSPHEKADILIIDTKKNESNPERVKKIAETKAWNVQQSCMLQWLGPDFSSRILYNDFRNGKYVSVVLTLATMEERVIPAAVYSVSADGKFALTLDFSRLYELRPGYGYYNMPERTKGIALPDTTAIWKVNLETSEVTELLRYTDFANFQPRPEMKEEGSVHKVNHIMLSPNGKRFMVLYRWFCGQRKYTRLITCNVDGTEMYVLSDDDMVSHCCWKNNSTILAFENKKKGGPGYYLMKDKTDKYIHCWPQFSNDGHPSYSPDGSLIVTDSYPDRSRIASINLMDGNERKRENTTIARVFAPFKYDNDTRCDLHPRWNHAGDRICFDSVFEGHRGLYVVDINVNKESKSHEKSEKTKDIDVEYTIITPMYNSFGMMGRYFNSLRKQTYKNFEVIIVDDCSTDGSYEKALEYANRSELNIKVFRSGKNSGPGNARNIGMDEARGEWITFVDSDDWVSINLLEKINAVIKKEDVNCIIYDCYIADGKSKRILRSMYNNEGGKILLGKCIANVRNHSVGKVYRLKKCNEAKIRYPELNRCEDVAFVCRAIDACGSVYYLKEPMYYYFQRAESLSNNSNLDEADMVKAFSILEESLGEKYPGELKEKSVPDLFYGVLLMMCKAGKSSEEIVTYIDEYEKKYPKWFECESFKNLGKTKEAFLMAAKLKMPLVMRLMAAVHSKLVKGGQKNH